MINKIYGMLGLASKAGKITCGYDACMEEVKKRKSKIIIIADDISDKTKLKVKEICKQNNIECIEYGKMLDLSMAIGKQNKAIFSIKDKNFAEKIKNLVSGGEIIG